MVTRRRLFAALAALPFVGKAFSEHPLLRTFTVAIGKRDSNITLFKRLLVAAKEHGLEIWTAPDGRRMLEAYDDSGRLLAALVMRFQKTCTLSEARELNWLLQTAAQAVNSRPIRGREWSPAVYA